MRGIESMAYPLPEDIQVRVHAGDFAGALGLIDIYVKEGIAPLLNDRLELERQRIERMSANYPYTRLQAISMAQAGI
ncbi:MAG: transglutaminase domain-containing protein, partial [Clostridiales bacterium]|nr:transglutaminase domain-containing protein [Clostridiales bacterium]